MLSIIEQRVDKNGIYIKTPQKALTLPSLDLKGLTKDTLQTTLALYFTPDAATTKADKDGGVGIVNVSLKLDGEPLLFGTEQP